MQLCPALCLDASSQDVANGVAAKSHTCGSELDGVTPIPAYTLYATEDNHFAITGGSAGMDVDANSTPTSTKPDGTLQNVQWWTCSLNDPQQVISGRLALLCSLILTWTLLPYQVFTF